MVRRVAGWIGAWALVTTAACGGPSGAVDSGGGTDVRAMDAPTEAGTDAPVQCTSDPQCADGVFCNGAERCAPLSPMADVHGCIAGPAPCAAGQSCDEAHSMCAAASCDHPDADGDGHASTACGGDDCDDADPHTFPGNTEVCAVMMNADGTLTRVDPGHDEDCDPTTFANAATHDGDHDGDGYVDSMCCNSDHSGGTQCGNDCADLAPRASPFPSMPAVPAMSIHPGATEACNGVDDNCNTRVDDGLASAAYYRDCDGDGYGDHADAGTPGCGAEQFMACMGHSAVTNNGDCNDGSALVHPMAPEVCDNVDNDCDGTVDGAMATAACSAMLAPSATAMACVAGRCAVATCLSGYADCDHIASNGCEVQPAGDASNCGTCGHVCPTGAGTAVCMAGTCGFSTCSSGLFACGGGCVPPTTAHCGAACTVCSAPANGTVACNGSGTTWSCQTACNAGYVQSGGGCVVIAAPRPIAPLSTATVTSQRPTLRWALGANSDGAHVDICYDRACSRVITTIDATGTSATPATALPAGNVFWRLRGRNTAAAAPGFGVSPVWEFTVGHRTAPTDTSWGNAPDVNGDGFADILIADPSLPPGHQAGEVFVYLGGASGPSGSSPSATITGTRDFGELGMQLVSVGDVNGDGFADIYLGQEPTTGMPRGYLYLGGGGGLSHTSSAAWAVVCAAGTVGAVAPAGDVNGDGYADIVIDCSTGTSAGNPVENAEIHLGGPTGIATGAATTIPGQSYSYISIAEAGDLNGDGFADLAVLSYQTSSFPSDTLQAFAGSASGIRTLPSAVIDVAGYSPESIFGAGDVNGDGRSDLGLKSQAGSTTSSSAVEIFQGTASLLGSTPTTTISGVTGTPGTGDFDGDGYGDFVAGALVMSTDVVGFFPGSASGVAVRPASMTGSYSEGVRVYTAGDVNDDGYADAIDLSPYGYTHWIPGNPSGSPADASVMLYSSTDSLYFAMLCARPPGMHVHAKPRVGWASREAAPHG